MIDADVGGAEERALFAEFRERLALWCGLEEGAEVVTEDAGEDHYYCYGQEDPVARSLC